MFKKVKIVRVDSSLGMPCYQTLGAVGFDFLARVETKISPGQIGIVPGNLIVEVPDGYMLCLASRSSLPSKKGLLTPHGIGVIDLDYHGPDDEIKIQVYNFTDKEAIIHRGDRIAQGIFVRVDRFEFEEVSKISDNSRGGFGSTGLN